MKIKRWLIISGAAALFIISIVYGFLPRPVIVDVVKALRMPMKVTVEEEGQTRVKDKFAISSPVTGFMRRIPFDVGDAVIKGQKIAEIEPLRSDALDPRSYASAQTAVSAAEAALKAAKENASAASAEEEYARANLERTIKLFNAGYTYQDIMDKSDRDAKRANANRLAAEALVKVARSELDRARVVLREFGPVSSVSMSHIAMVHSPVSGYILRIHKESEGAVNAGEPLVDIGNLNRLEVEIEVLTEYAIKIKPGTPVAFERWGGEQILYGTVRVVEPAGFTKISSLGVEEQRTLVIADITSMPESWQRLGDGYRVEARFIIWAGENILQVPASAIFRKGDKWALFAVKNNRAVERQVEIGQRTGLTVEVLSGVSEGDIVIAYPDELIKEGTLIKQK